MDERQEYINSQYERRFDKLENRIDKIENKIDSFEISQKEQTLILNQIKSDLDKRKARNESNLNSVIMQIVCIVIGGIATIVGTALLKK